MSLTYGRRVWIHRASFPGGTVATRTIPDHARSYRLQCVRTAKQASGPRFTFARLVASDNSLVEYSPLLLRDIRRLARCSRPPEAGIADVVSTDGTPGPDGTDGTTSGQAGTAGHSGRPRTLGSSRPIRRPRRAVRAARRERRQRRGSRWGRRCRRGWRRSGGDGFSDVAFHDCGHGHRRGDWGGRRGGGYARRAERRRCQRRKRGRCDLAGERERFWCDVDRHRNGRR